MAGSAAGQEPEGRRGPRNRNSIDRVSGAVGSSRFLVSLAILGVVVSSLATLAYSLVVLAVTLYEAFTAGEFEIEGAKHLAVELIELTDFFLLGMVLYVVGMGMYQLFIDREIDVPAWMRVSSLDDLKTQLLNVTVVLLAISFLGVVVDWSGGQDIVYIGAAIGAVIVALSLYLFTHQHQHDDPHQ